MQPHNSNGQFSFSWRYSITKLEFTCRCSQRRRGITFFANVFLYHTIFLSYLFPSFFFPLSFHFLCFSVYSLSFSSLSLSLFFLPSLFPSFFFPLSFPLYSSLSLSLFFLPSLSLSFPLFNFFCPIELGGSVCVVRCKMVFFSHPPNFSTILFSSDKHILFPSFAKVFLKNCFS